MAQPQVAKEKKKFKVPHSYVIICTLLIVVAILTYIIPAGSFERTVDDAGKTVINTDVFNYVEQSGVPLWELPSLVITSLNNQSDIIFALIVIGGCLEIILRSNVFQAYLTALSRKFSNQGVLLIPVFLLVFGFLGMTQSADRFIAFAPVGVLLSTALGFEAIVGIAIVLLGVGTGFNTGVLQSTTAIAQEIAGLPAFSGISMRIVSFILFFIVNTIFIMGYCRKIKKDPTKSYVSCQCEQYEQGVVSWNLMH